MQTNSGGSPKTPLPKRVVEFLLLGIRKIKCTSPVDWCLPPEQLGIERPDPTKKETRHNNRKQSFSKMERSIALECARKCGLEIEEIPAEPGKQTMALEQYVAQKEREALAAVMPKKRL